jgi:hypothetical protein
VDSGDGACFASYRGSLRLGRASPSDTKRATLSFEPRAGAILLGALYSTPMAIIAVMIATTKRTSADLITSLGVRTSSPVLAGNFRSVPIPVVVDSLKALDPNRPIREADIRPRANHH